MQKLSVVRGVCDSSTEGIVEPNYAEEDIV